LLQLLENELEAKGGIPSASGNNEQFLIIVNYNVHCNLHTLRPLKVLDPCRELAPHGGFLDGNRFPACRLMLLI